MICRQRIVVNVLSLTFLSAHPLSPLQQQGVNMKLKFFAVVGAVTASFAATVVANEPVKFDNGLLVARNGMTLYTFDKDSKNRSNCEGGCLVAWPALTADDSTKVSGDFGFIMRSDGKKQVAMDGKPLYFYVGDTKPGDVTGDGSGGVWHVVRNPASRNKGESPRRAETNSNSGYNY
jgi:predicted lipoprotein with Yx(FWY)xxD motif